MLLYQVVKQHLQVLRVDAFTIEALDVKIKTEYTLYNTVDESLLCLKINLFRHNNK